MKIEQVKIKPLTLVTGRVNPVTLIAMVTETPESVTKFKPIEIDLKVRKCHFKVEK